MSYKQELLKEIKQKLNESLRDYDYLEAIAKKEKLDSNGIDVLMSVYQKAINLQGLVQFYNSKYKDKTLKKVESGLEMLTTLAEKTIKEGLLIHTI